MYLIIPASTDSRIIKILQMVGLTLIYDLKKEEKDLAKCNNTGKKQDVILTKFKKKWES